MIPAGGEVTVAAALLHVVSPQQEKLLITVMPHTFIPLTRTRKVSCICYICGDVSHIHTLAFHVSPCTFSGAGFHYEANKGRAVSPEIRQALTEQQ